MLCGVIIMQIKLVVTTRFIHPHFGGMEIKQKDFTDLNAAQDYFRKCRSEDESSGGFQSTTIEVVQF